MHALVIMFSLVGLAGDSEVPIECQTHEAIDTQSKLQMSMCAARARIAALTHLRDSDVSVLALEVAAAPTLSVLDDVIATERPVWQAVALQFRGDVYIAMTARMREANASPARVTTWLVRARRAYSDARMIEVGLRAAPPRAEEMNP